MVEEKKFSHFLEFPAELRMMMIDKIETRDRCRFSGSSKLCNKEAKASKNYIYGLELFSSVSSSYIAVMHGRSDNEGFSLRFEKEKNQNWIICEIIEGVDRELWREQLDNSTNLVKFAIDNFGTILRKYQSTIKELDIFIVDSIVKSKNVDFEIESLNKLEILTVCHSVDIRQFLPKTRKNLKKLSVLGKTNGRLLEDSEQIYQVQDVLEVPYTRLSNEQFLRVSAPFVVLHIGHLTEDDIFDFIKSWQNEKIGRNMEIYVWNLTDSNFNVRKLFELFGEQHDGYRNKYVDVKHDKNGRRTARLSFSAFFGPQLAFRQISPVEFKEDVFKGEYNFLLNYF